MEAIFTMGLVGVCIVLLSGILESYSRATRTLGAKDASLRAVHAVLHGIRAEVMEAVTFVTPAATAVTSNQLRFTKVDPNVLDRLTNPAGNWTPYDRASVAPSNDFLVDVLYEVQGGILTRAVRFASDGSFQPPSPVSEEVVNFECERFNDGTIELRLEVADNTGTSVYSSRVFRRVR